MLHILVLKSLLGLADQLDRDIKMVTAKLTECSILKLLNGE
jgi:hypothetical protein